MFSVDSSPSGSLPSQQAQTKPQAAPLPWWLWCNVLSVDAPAVAAVWALVFARSSSAAIPKVTIFVLVCCVWLIYFADRLLDGLGAEECLLKERHHFCSRNSAAILSLLGAGGVITACAVGRDLSLREIEAGLAVAAIVGGYLLCVHAARKSLARFIPKEVLVGLLFAAGTTLPVWSRAGEISAEMLITWTLFAFVCALNCVAIECWENDAAQLTGFIRWCDSRLGAIAVVLLGTAVVARIFFTTGVAGPPMLAIGVAALLMLVLNSLRDRLSRPALRVLADAALVVGALLAMLRQYCI